MRKLVVLVGPPGSGKSTLAKQKYSEFIYINQDTQGKEGHMRQFLQSISEGEDIIVDRMGFNKQQRDAYIIPAKNNNYETQIVVLHESQNTCLERMLLRQGHPTIQDEKSARSALHTFMTKYERPEAGEADVIEFVYPKGDKPTCIGVDLDGTLCNIDHRLHFVQGEGKKDWKNFLYNIPYDSVNAWCKELINAMHFSDNQIVYCSGRGSEYRGQTMQWLKDHKLFELCEDRNNLKNWVENRIAPTPPHLYMRERGDHRADTVIKEILLDFEILTRFTPVFFVDDRPSVCRMWRSRGFNCLQIQDKEF